MPPGTPSVARRPGLRLPGWRVLGGAWAAVLLVTAIGAGTLQALGPPPGPPNPAMPPPATPPIHAAAAEPAAQAPKPEPATVPTSSQRLPAAAPPRTAVRGPVAALLEPPGTQTEVLPRIAPDGRMPRLVYAAPAVVVPAATTPIALLLSGFGPSEQDSRTALRSLPGPVSFAVSSDTPPASRLLDEARKSGHELLASIPMEPDGYPQADEGVRSLVTTATPEENSRNLAWALSRTPGAVGATGASDGMRGERFAEVTADFDPILAVIARRGLLYVDARPGRPAAQPGTASRAVDIVLDDQLGRAEIDARLATLERVAKEHGSAIGLAGPPRPATIERIAEWAKTLQDRGFVLVPVSQLVNADATTAQK